MEMKSHNKRLIAFDFDGVICNSAPEMGASCFDVAWELLTGKDVENSIIADERTKFLPFFNTVRPYLEVGYQGILVALWFIAPDLCESLPLPQEGSPSALWENFLATLTSRLPALFPDRFPGQEQYSDELTARLGERRDALLATDPVEWLRLNPLYSDMAVLLQRLLTSEHNVIAIVSTKQTRFIRTILENAAIKIDHSLIFGLEAGQKESVIYNLLECHSPNLSYFIEDRVETLRRFSLDRRFKELTLLFATWGYATPDQHKMVVEDPRITAVTHKSFADMMT
jgi:phosphoglycolate phosphatase-like HAD superfamily hydrolase